MKFSKTFIDLVNANIKNDNMVFMKSTLLQNYKHAKTLKDVELLQSLRATRTMEDIATWVAKVGEYGSSAIMVKIVLDGWYWAKSAEGEHFWMQVHSVPMKDAEGELVEYTETQQLVINFIGSGNALDFMSLSAVTNPGYTNEDF